MLLHPYHMLLHASLRPKTARGASQGAAPFSFLPTPPSSPSPHDYVTVQIPCPSSVAQSVLYVRPPPGNVLFEQAKFEF
jgi:hypothetical protein